MFARRTPRFRNGDDDSGAPNLLEARRMRRIRPPSPDRPAEPEPEQPPVTAASFAPPAGHDTVLPELDPPAAVAPDPVRTQVPATREPPGGHYQRMAKIVSDAKTKVLPILFDRIDTMRAAALPREELSIEIESYVDEILRELKQILTAPERRMLITVLLDEMVGYGPLQPLLHDDSITEIMVNGARQVYVERDGKVELTDVHFYDDAHVMHVAYRIVSQIGRRIDESSPMCDARLPDGSRVNIIIPPLAIKGPTVSIRKFAKKKLTLDRLVAIGSMSRQMAGVLKVATRAKLNILISGGTGSGKTTMLNALSQMIEQHERVITIEDAAELQLQQPHVISLETRAPNIEGQGAVSIRDLLRNSLRMRPDRIIVGEVRGDEVIDMLQAMNTGHEGSLGTVHANTPRDALIRMENMIALSGFTLPSKAIRTQIVAAIDLIVQVARTRDGGRKVTQITEVVGMESDVIITQDLFSYDPNAATPDGRHIGAFVYNGLTPHFLPKAAAHGLEKVVLDLLHLQQVEKGHQPI
ncbi:MAG: CpaF family protein [Rhodospirillales bacterium]